MFVHTVYFWLRERSHAAADRGVPGRCPLAHHHRQRQAGPLRHPGADRSAGDRPFVFTRPDRPFRESGRPRPLPDRPDSRPLPRRLRDVLEESPDLRFDHLALDRGGRIIYGCTRGTGRARHRRGPRHRQRHRDGAGAPRLPGRGQLLTSTPELADATVAEIEASGGRAFAVQGDVSVAASVERMFARRHRARPAASTLHVNNAGVQTWGPLLDVTEEEWDRVIDTNLKGCFLCTQQAARHMKDHGGGVIINIGSGCNKVAFPDLVAYTASKGGIEMFTKVAAVELGPHRIRVNCVAPGAVEVERTQARGPRLRRHLGPHHAAPPRRPAPRHRPRRRLPGEPGGGVRHRPDDLGRRGHVRSRPMGLQAAGAE